MTTRVTPRTIPPMRGIAAAFTFALMLGALLAPQIANAKDDKPAFFPFQSRFWQSTPGWKGAFSCTISREKGDMILSEPGPLIPDVYNLGLAWAYENGEPVKSSTSNAAQSHQLLMATDVSISVVARLANSDTWLGLFARAQGSGTAYTCNLTDTGVLSLSIFGGPRLATQPTLLDPINTDVVVKFETIGNEITASAWAVESPDDAWLIIWTSDEEVPADGVMGLGVVGLGPNADKAAVIFRQVEIETMPPSSIDGD